MACGGAGDGGAAAGDGPARQKSAKAAGAIGHAGARIVGDLQNPVEKRGDRRLRVVDRA
jgi:hypothetical protein